MVNCAIFFYRAQHFQQCSGHIELRGMRCITCFHLNSMYLFRMGLTKLIKTGTIRQFVLLIQHSNTISWQNHGKHCWYSGIRAISIQQNRLNIENIAFFFFKLSKEFGEYSAYCWIFNIFYLQVYKHGTYKHAGYTIAIIPMQIIWTLITFVLFDEKNENK